jgi:glucose-1-phosphate thymidylyltransferase
LKGLILCGGKGSRLRPLTFSRPKHLLPVMNKPVLFYGIESLIEAGIRQIAIVVPPGYRQVFDDALNQGVPWGIDISLIEQPEPKGLADAVRVAQSYIQDDDFLLFLGDNVIDGSLQPLVDKFQSEQLEGLISVSHVDHPEQFGVVQMEGDNLVKVVEKPANPPSHLAINGVYLFRSSLFQAIAEIKPSARGEYEITDAIQRLIDSRYRLGVYRSPHWWKDTGKPKDLIMCNQYFLQKIEGLHVLGEIDAASSVSSPVIIGENAVVRNSIIRGPVIIGAHTTVENAYIGPYSSISEHVIITNCELENSIVMENTVLENIPHRIDESLIGAEVSMKGKSQQPQILQLWIGDYSQLSFPG